MNLRWQLCRSTTLIGLSSEHENFVDLALTSRRAIEVYFEMLYNFNKDHVGSREVAGVLDLEILPRLPPFVFLFHSNILVGQVLVFREARSGFVFDKRI